MDTGLYAACAALMARTQALDTVANNLANVNTTGFKGESPFYQALAAANGTDESGGGLAAAINRFGVLGGQTLDLQAGSIENTGNPLDVAVQGAGFLSVQRGDATVYTRAGNLQLGANGTLETASGDAVLGANGGPIVLPSGTPAISGDGTVSVDGALVGRIQLSEFKAGAGLEPLGDSYFSAPAGAAQPATGSTLKAGALESSNVNPISAEVDLISLQRGSDLLERALKIFNTDFDQTAVQIAKL